MRKWSPRQASGVCNRHRWTGVMLTGRQWTVDSETCYLPVKIRAPAKPAVPDLCTMLLQCVPLLCHISGSGPLQRRAQTPSTNTCRCFACCFMQSIITHPPPMCRPSEMGNDRRRQRRHRRQGYRRRWYMGNNDQGWTTIQPSCVPCWGKSVST